MAVYLNRYKGVMSIYNYKKGKEKIIEILNTKTNIIRAPYMPLDLEELTYDNAYLTWVGAIFIDIKGSSELFIKKDERLARLMRAFIREAIVIMADFELYREIGIRGDSVYAIYDINTREHLVRLFKVAITLNSFLRMLNKLIVEKGYDEIEAGIGIGADENLIVKAGYERSGVSDRIWIGRAVVDASNLADMANRNGLMPICISDILYKRIIDDLVSKNEGFRYFIKHNKELNIYECNIVDSELDKWIDEGMM